MPDVVGFKEKVNLVCQLNAANNRQAPCNRTELAHWLGLAPGTLSPRYALPAPNLTVSLERAIVMALGFGPPNSEFLEHGEGAWNRWGARWSKLWRTGPPTDFVAQLEEANYFVERQKDDPRIALLMQRTGRRRNKTSRAVSPSLNELTSPIAGVSTTESRYLDRLASLQVSCRRQQDVDVLVADLTFGAVEVKTDDASYLVAINRCHAEILLQQASFEPLLETAVVASRSTPMREMKVEREFSRLNHPSWRLYDTKDKTPLKGEYCELNLGIVRGEICGDDEASLLVHKAGFAVSARGSELGEGGILTSLLKYLVTEHVGEIEQRGSSSLYHLSAGSISVRRDDD